MKAYVVEYPGESSRPSIFLVPHRDLAKSSSVYMQAVSIRWIRRSAPATQPMPGSRCPRYSAWIWREKWKESGLAFLYFAQERKFTGWWAALAACRGHWRNTWL